LKDFLRARLGRHALANRFMCKSHPVIRSFPERRRTRTASTKQWRTGCRRDGRDDMAGSAVNAVGNAMSAVLNVLSAW
jgi:hypothetical protein